MFKSVLRLFKLDREKLTVPRSVQKVLKIQQMWPDGVFRVGRKKYSKCFKFEDINYAVASHEDQELMFLQYSQVLNSLDPGAMTNVTTVTVEVIYRDLKIYVKTKNASQAANMYAFSDEQNKVLTEMMSKQFTKSWSDLIYGYSYGDEDIVAVAISQIGNVGGEPYWRWYGLSSRTEWCAIFVSWCADQCGYLDSGVIPKFAWVPDAVSWFQARGQWLPCGHTPAPGDIIFFDWEGDGGANHVGIVEYVENGVVHTVEGNSGDACRRKEYFLNSPVILGYGKLSQ